jgi:fatty acid desaturase
MFENIKSIKLRAALITMVALLSIVLGSVVIALFAFYASTQVVIIAIMVSLLAFLGYIFYTSTLSELKYKEILQKMVDEK